MSAWGNGKASQPRWLRQTYFEVQLRLAHSVEHLLQLNRQLQNRGNEHKRFEYRPPTPNPHTPSLLILSTRRLTVHPHSMGYGL